MSHLILLTGGVRSGKSAQAERLLAGSPAVLYIATARCLDGEMARRIEAHRSRRPAHWVTAEASAALDEVLRAHPEGDVLLDCVTNMVTNLMLDEEPEYEALSRARVEEIEAHIEEEIDRLLSGLLVRGELSNYKMYPSGLRQRSGLAVLVTGEVGLGLVAPYRMGRIFADILGKVNQQLAAQADEAYFMACGFPIRLK